MEEKKDIINEMGYKQWFYPPRPTKVTKFFRTFFVWQFVRFIIINLKMLKVVSKSH